MTIDEEANAVLQVTVDDLRSLFTRALKMAIDSVSWCERCGQGVLPGFSDLRLQCGCEEEPDDQCDAEV